LPYHVSYERLGASGLVLNRIPRAGIDVQSITNDKARLLGMSRAAIQ